MTHARADRTLAATALALAFSAALAAACAHVAIDLAGDVLLVRDAYDGVAHDTRTVLGVGAVAGALLLAFRFLIGALDPSPASRRRIAELRRGLLPRLGAGFAALAAAGTLVVLVAMEALDTLAAGRIVDDPADLLGGSPVLGIAIAATIGIAVSAFVRLVLVWLLAVGDALSHAISVRFLRRDRHRRARHADRRQRGTRPRIFAPLAHRLAKRGPPPLLVARPVLTLS